VEWVGPDGKKRPANVYKWLDAVRLMTPNKDNYKDYFLPLAPGEERVISPGGTGDGFIHLNGAQPGKNRVRVSYKNRNTGKELGWRAVWVGTVTSAEVTFEGGKEQVLVRPSGKKPAATVEVVKEGKCAAAVGDTVLFSFSFNPTASPSGWIRTLEVSINGK